MTTAIPGLNVNTPLGSTTAHNATNAQRLNDDVQIANSNDLFWARLMKFRMSVQSFSPNVQNPTFASPLLPELPWTKNSTILCGFPGFCQYQAYWHCTNTTLYQCGQCDFHAANFIIFFCILVGVLILLGNSVVILVSSIHKPPDTFSKIKISLAVADILVGLQVLVMFPYNMSWTLRSTSLQLQRYQAGLRGSTQAILGGCFFLFTFTSSLYHLIYLGGERLCAIRWPFLYRKQKSHHVIAALVVVWALSALAATVPLWFPKDLVFTYYPTLFAYFFAQKDVANPNRTAVVITLTVFYVLPIIFMTIVCVLMAVTAYQRYGGSSNQQLTSREKQQNSEKRIYRVVGLMQLGFLLTQLPFVICFSLFYGKVMNCTNMSDPFLITFYISILNSLVNVVVYSVMDPKFRVSIKQLFGCHVHKKPPTNQKTPSFSNRVVAKYKPSTGNTTS